MKDNKLPTVEDGIMQSLMQSYKEHGDGSFSYLKEFWRDIKENQPVLADIIVHEMRAFKDNKLAGAFTHGVFLTYALLKSQAEVDELREMWED